MQWNIKCTFTAPSASICPQTFSRKRHSSVSKKNDVLLCDSARQQTDKNYTGKTFGTRLVCSVLSAMFTWSSTNQLLTFSVIYLMGKTFSNGSRFNDFVEKYNPTSPKPVQHFAENVWKRFLTTKKLLLIIEYK